VFLPLNILMEPPTRRSTDQPILAPATASLRLFGFLSPFGHVVISALCSAEFWPTEYLPHGRPNLLARAIKLGRHHRIAGLSGSLSWSSRDSRLQVMLRAVSGNRTFKHVGLCFKQAHKAEFSGDRLFWPRHQRFPARCAISAKLHQAR
jgi:hypothetical protein